MLVFVSDTKLLQEQGLFFCYVMEGDTLCNETNEMRNGFLLKAY